MRRIILVAPLAALFLLFAGNVAQAQTVGTWDARTAVPATLSSAGNTLASVGNTKIYHLHVDGTALSVYTIAANSWVALTGSTCGFAVGGGTFLIAADADHLYATCPSGVPDFIRYTISTDTWDDRTGTPLGVGPGASAVWDGGDHIYVLAGNSSVFFYRYSISGDTWVSLAFAPAGIGIGGSLAYPGSGDYLYALRGGGFATTYRYSIIGDSWSDVAVADSPDTVAGGGSLVSDGSNTLYSLRGGVQTDFWSYSISGDSWTTLTAAPAAVDSGGALAYITNSSGTFLSGTRGSGTTDFNRYTISLITASSGGSAGSRVGSAATAAALVRAIPPNAPQNVVPNNAVCHSPCNASIDFTYDALSIHEFKPGLTFVLKDDAGNILASQDAPSGASGKYTITARNLPENAKINGLLYSALNGINSTNGAPVHIQTPFYIKGDSISVITTPNDIGKGLFNVAFSIKDLSPNITSETALLVKITDAAGNNVFDGALSLAKNPVVVPIPILSGKFTAHFTPIAHNTPYPNESSVLDFTIAEPAPPIAATVTVQSEKDGVVASTIDAKAIQHGDSLFIDARVAAANNAKNAATETNLLPAMVSGGATFTLSITDKSGHTFQFNGVCGVTGCGVRSVIKKEGNASGAVSYNALNNNGKTIVTTSGASVLMSQNVFPVIVNMANIASANFRLTTPLSAAPAGKNTLNATLKDALGNTLTVNAPFEITTAIQAPATTINALSAAQEQTTLTTQAQEPQLSASASVTSNAGNASLALNFSDADGNPVNTTAQSFAVAERLSDGATYTFYATCDAAACHVVNGAKEGDNGAQDISSALAIVPHTNKTESVSVNGNSVLTYNPDPAARFAVTGGADAKDIAVNAGFAAIPSGEYTVTATANNGITQKMKFAATGGEFDLRAIIAQLFDLGPGTVYYTQNQLAPDVGVTGGHIIAKPLIQQITDALAPTNPLVKLLNGLKDFFAPVPTPAQ